MIRYEQEHEKGRYFYLFIGGVQPWTHVEEERREHECK